MCTKAAFGNLVSWNLYKNASQHHWEETNYWSVPAFNTRGQCLLNNSILVGFKVFAFFLFKALMTNNTIIKNQIYKSYFLTTRDQLESLFVCFWPIWIFDIDICDLWKSLKNAHSQNQTHKLAFRNTNLHVHVLLLEYIQRLTFVFNFSELLVRSVSGTRL